ncbi:MAG: FG-GAP-like repeat-containing protein, partial [Bryobacteraceae bacterium]
AGNGAWYGAVGDFNRDGKADVAVANFSSNSISILLGNDDGTLQPPVNYPAGNLPQWIEVADLNGDPALCECGSEAWMPRCSARRWLRDSRRLCKWPSAAPNLPDGDYQVVVEVGGVASPAALLTIGR